MRVFRGHREEYGRDQLTWFSTDRDHAEYFGEIKEYELDLSDNVFKIDLHNEDTFDVLKEFADDARALCCSGGYEFEDVLLAAAEKYKVDAIIIENGEGKGICIRVTDAPWVINEV